MLNVGANNINNLYVGNSEVLRAYLGSELVYENIRAIKFTALEDNSTLGLAKKFTGSDIEYSIDGAEWSGFTTATTVTLDTDDVIYVRGVSSGEYPYPNINNYTNFSMTGKFSISGDINGLLNHNRLSMNAYDYCAYKLFYNCESLVHAKYLLLPSLNLGQYCYSEMFCGCTNLLTAPELPATTATSYCYRGMFSLCESLMEAPELPATKLNQSCYDEMFKGCTNLVTAPELPATELQNSCYSSMFARCTGLTSAPELPATETKPDCYHSMFAGCTSLTTAPELPATALTTNCYYVMFSGCTNLTTAPELPAEVLETQCYRGMFAYCEKIEYIKCLATDISASNCTSNWVLGVAENGTFVKNKNMTWGNPGPHTTPPNWSVVDNSE